MRVLKEVVPTLLLQITLDRNNYKGGDDLMKASEKKIPRILRKNNEKLNVNIDKREDTVKAEEAKKAEKVLDEGDSWVFNKYNIKRIKIINIHTTYNDYKKLHDDMKSTVVERGRNVTSFSECTNIQDMVSGRELLRMCRKEKMVENVALLNVLKISEVFLCFLSIFQIFFTYFDVKNNLIPNNIFILFILLLLIPVIFIPIVVMQKEQKNKALEKLNELEEDELINLYGNMGQRGSYLRDEKIYFVENFSRLNKNCRCYLIAYLYSINDLTQLWCIFDYIFEKARKITITGDNKKYEEYKLEPLSYEEKENLYKEFDLQRELSKEYLNCIGVDILWTNRESDPSGNVKLHSLDFVGKKIEEIRKGFDEDGGLTKVFYCLVYMSAKYKYSFSINQIISLIQNGEKVNKELYGMICGVGKAIGSRIKKKNEIERYFNKVIEVLEGYYFTEYGSESGRQVRKYKFSYDILECFQEKLSVAYYPDEKNVKKWILVKLLGNIEMFKGDRYFFDCSNLLVTNNFLNDKEFCILASNLLKMMNRNNCWFYYVPILRILRDIDSQKEEWKYLEENEIKTAAINSMFYVSDEQSMEHGLYFLTGSVENHFVLDGIHPWMEEMKQSSELLAGYFQLLYKIFVNAIAIKFEFGKAYEDIDVEILDEQEYLPNIIRELITFYVVYLNKKNVEESFNECNKRILACLKKIRVCDEAKVFSEIVEELLSWIRSEINSKGKRAYRNVNVGMLIEASNSNMLYFIYSLFDMIIMKDNEIVYENHNKLLGFISQSVFYFRVTTRGKGITKYIKELINSKLSIELKMNIALCILISCNTCLNILREFILENMECMNSLISERLSTTNEEWIIEEYISVLLICNKKIGSEEFTERILDNILRCLPKDSNAKMECIQKYLDVICYKKCQEEECANIIDEINQIASCSFATLVFDGYCDVKKEMLERVPWINERILLGCRNTSGLFLMGKYLLGHGYFDCNRKILKLYLAVMRGYKYPDKEAIIIYMNIIDSYARDNASFKVQESFTYNYFLSLLFFYMALEAYEEKELTEAVPIKTLEFLLAVIEELMKIGMSIKEGWLRGENVVEKNEETETFIISNFQELKPVIEVDGQKELSLDYYIMVTYIYSFPDIYSELAKRVEGKDEEVIKQKHIRYLVTILLNYSEKEMPGFDRDNMERVKDILDKMYKFH